MAVRAPIDAAAFASDRFRRGVSDGGQHQMREKKTRGQMARACLEEKRAAQMGAFALRPTLRPSPSLSLSLDDIHPTHSAQWRVVSTKEAIGDRVI